MAEPRPSMPGLTNSFGLEGIRTSMDTSYITETWTLEAVIFKAVHPADLPMSHLCVGRAQTPQSDLFLQLCIPAFTHEIMLLSRVTMNSSKWHYKHCITQCSRLSSTFLCVYKIFIDFFSILITAIEFNEKAFFMQQNQCIVIGENN